MILRSAILVASLCLALNFSVKAQARVTANTVSPQALVADLYRQHKRKSPFFQHTNRALVDRYFSKTLADLIWNMPNSPDEVGPLDGDPLYNAQDMEIRKFSIHRALSENGLTKVPVTFTNIGKPQTINFLFTRERGGWKISNIQYDDGTDLATILKGNDAPAQIDTEVMIYLVAVGDKGAIGKKIGCDDSLVAVSRFIKPTPAPLAAVLRELLSTPQYSEGTRRLENFWKGRNLKLESVSIRNGLATIRISGELSVAGVCDEPRIEAQIEATAKQFPTVKKVRVFIGRRTLADAIR